MSFDRRLLVHAARLTTLFIIGLCTAPLSATASGGTYPIVFSDGAFTGTVTYAAHGDLAPTAVSVSWGTCTWTLDDLVSGADSALWTGDQPTAVGSAAHTDFKQGAVDNFAFDSVGMGYIQNVFVFADPAAMCSGVATGIVSGTYTITPHVHAQACEAGVNCFFGTCDPVLDYCVCDPGSPFGGCGCNVFGQPYSTPELCSPLACNLDTDCDDGLSCNIDICDAGFCSYSACATVPAVSPHKRIVLAIIIVMLGSGALVGRHAFRNR